MIAVIDSGGANIASVIFALERLGAETIFTADPEIIQNAERVILPGVGAAADAMRQLQAKNLVSVIQSLRQPVLGVCLGMQLLFTHSAEANVDLLNVIPANVVHLPIMENLPVPHMGWNSLDIQETQTDGTIVQNLSDGSYCYFVHSYAAPVGDYTLASCRYGTDFSAIVRKDNFMGCQFHPERSSAAGQKVLENFLSIQP